jgi:PAS domain S-box-containing protein
LNLYGPIAPVEARFPAPARAVFPLLRLNAIVLLVCLGAAVAGVVLTPTLEQVTALWPLSGVGLAVFLIWGNRIWPGVLLANLISNFLLSISAPAALAISAAATLGPAAAAWTFRQLKVDLTLGSIREVLRYIAIASVLAFVAVPTAGVAAMAFSQPWSWEQAGDLWGRWAMADCLSVLAITPLLLWVFKPPREEQRRAPAIPFPVSAAFLGLITLACYSLSRPVGYPVLLVVVLIAVLYSQRELAIAVLVAVTLALWEAAYRDWLLLEGPEPSILRVLDFLIFMTIGSLLLGACMAESRRKDALLLRANQERLKQSEARFEDVFDISGQGMAIVSLEGSWLRVNAALCHILGYSEAELLTMNFRTLTHPDDLAHDREAIRTMLAGETGSRQFEKRYIHRSGKVVVVLLSVILARDAQGKPLNYVVQVMDITDRKRAEELWRFGLEGAGDVVWDWDIPSGSITFSGKVQELLGCNEASAPKTTSAWRSLIHPDYHAVTAEKGQSLLNVPGYSYASEYKVRRADGSYKWVLSRGLVMARDRDNKPIRAVGTIVDMTEVRRLQDKLHQSDKMAALGQLTGGVAHDVNNDLGVIVGSAELILERSEPGSREEALSSRIISTVRRSTDLVRRMLAFSRQAEIAPEPLELVEFLTGFIDTMGRTLGTHIQTRLHVADRAQSYWVSLDRSMLESCLINLAINARDAMPGGGVLTLSLARERDASGETVLLSVADTGTGMSEAVRQRIFEPFFTTKPAGGGTGLGLAMVYGFVQQSGGRIEVESEIGAGTRFALRFPAAAAQTERTRVIAPDAKKLARSVLLVDDNEALRATLREQLVSLDCTVQEAANFEQAIAILRSGKPIGFILSDFDLGRGPDGIELARWAQAHAGKIPGAILSGHLKSFAGLPANWRSVQKPVRREDLKMLLAASGGEKGTKPVSPQMPAVLVVEDNEGMRFVATEMLRRGGYMPLEAATAEEALLQLKNHPSIRLVISDVGLPDMLGGELAKNIRQHHPGVHVVLMSGSPSQSAGTPTEEVLPKPFSRAVLLRLVEEALART